MGFMYYHALKLNNRVFKDFDKIYILTFIQKFVKMKEEKFDIKVEYNKLKYKLPRFEELDNEFEISAIKEKTFLLRNIRRRINDKIIFYCKIIESLLYPSQSNFIGMVELKSFTDQEKEKISNIYKRLMQYERESLKLDVNPNEAGDVEYINNLLKEWDNLKKEMIKITEKMKYSWMQEDRPSRDTYFG